jgi:hypothetical protein
MEDKNSNNDNTLITIISRNLAKGLVVSDQPFFSVQADDLRWADPT